MAQREGRPASSVAPLKEELIRLWKVEKDPEVLSRLSLEIKKQGLFPDDEASISDGGLYPDVQNPNFVSRLLKKTEFADTESPPVRKDDNSCISGADFEVTPVQRFVANFLHPRTPYMSALLYHGVGVGKTCAAIQTAEAYLEVYPNRKVIIVAPPTIQAGFYRTIFDIENLHIGVGEALNYANGCTGDTYLRLTSHTNERNKDIIERDVRKAIKSRYEFYGYLQFGNYIRSILGKVSRKGNADEIRLREIDALKREFNYKLLVIDEAHNLRDVPSSGPVDKEEDTDTVGTEDEKDEAKSGKFLTPYLIKLLDSTDGIKLLMMTATPMFNSVLEIVHIFNLLLRNDKKETIAQGQIMDLQGNLIDGAEKIIKPIANAYISFMRGENPNNFPIRLMPEGLDPRGYPVKRITMDNYPRYIYSTKNDNINVDPDHSKRMAKLPLVKSECLEGSISYKVMGALTASGSRAGAGYTIIDSLLQAGNCVFPVGEDTPETFVGLKGFQNNFVKKGKGVISSKDATWLSEENINKYSPKMATILKYVQNSEGVCFFYSRFVISGALLMALVLEANGFTMYGRGNLLEQGIQSDGGRQCAFCANRERAHTDLDHEFAPAMYTLLTGDKEYSPNNKGSIDAARSDKNVNGGIVKIILGSQIAGEGLDLRFIREVHILDAWFHLNKTEQIIGRGIRFRSHCLIEDAMKRNTTVFLHVLTIQGYQNETADLYCYRSALLKAILVGQVSRALKVFAVDCNLRKNVTVLTGLGNRIQIDSQGDKRKGAKGDGILIDDMPYTAMCDWMECKYTCDPVVSIDVKSSNNSTYDSFSARYRESEIQKYIKSLFANQTHYLKDDLQQILIETGSPSIAINLTLQGILNNRLFRVTHGSREGYIIYKNGYFLFQPEVYKDTSIPLAIRALDFPIRRDEFTPRVMNKPVIEDDKEEVTELTSKELWNHLVTWIDKVIDGKLTGVGVEIERAIERYTPTFSQQHKSYTDKLSMIVFLAKMISDQPNKQIYKSIVLEYLWDEWLDSPTQISYYNTKDKVILSVAEENIVTSGEYEAFRYVDSQTNILNYICKDGEPCSRGIIEAFSRIDDPFKLATAVEGKTGFIYGFVVPKTGNMVFKTHKPHKEGASVKGGQECANVTSKEYSLKLKILSDEIKSKGVPIRGFSEINFYNKDSDISNSTQGCTLLNLVLRFMDKVAVDNKRWFFRPISAFYSGHLGRTTQEAKKAALTEKKALKKLEVKEKGKQKVEKGNPLEKMPVMTLKKPRPVIKVAGPVAPPPEAVAPSKEEVEAEISSDNETESFPPSPEFSPANSSPDTPVAEAPAKAPPPGPAAPAKEPSPARAAPTKKEYTIKGAAPAGLDKFKTIMGEIKPPAPAPAPAPPPAPAPAKPAKAPAIASLAAPPKKPYSVKGPAPAGANKLKALLEQRDTKNTRE